MLTINTITLCKHSKVDIDKCINKFDINITTDVDCWIGFTAD